MNPLKIADDLALAAWELAEAETLERTAAAFRKSAARRLGSAHMEFRAAMEQATGLRAKAFQARQEATKHPNK